MIITTQSPQKKTIINILILFLLLSLSSCEFALSPQHAIQEDSNEVTSNDNQPPSTPENLDNGTIRSNSYQIEWDASTDNVAVAGYHIYRDGSYLADSVSNSYTDISVDPASDYTYQVSAYDASDNESDLSDSVTGTTPGIVVADTEAPDVPENLTAGTLGPNSFPLSWNASDDNVAVVGYYIYRDGAYLAESSTTEYTDTTVSEKTEYSYRVSAYDATGNVSDRSESVTGRTPEVVSDTEAPTVPQGLAAVSIQAYSFSLSWTASTDNVAVAGYRIYRGGTQIAETVSTSYIDTTVSPETTYTYRVSAFDAANNESDSSDPVSGTTPVGGLSGSSTLIVDHTVVDHYADFVDVDGGIYLAAVKSMWVQVLGESHSEAYRDGLDLLESIDSRFQAETQEIGDNGDIPLSPTGEYLRLNRLYWNGSRWFEWGVGEEDFWTTSWARERMINNVAYCNGDGANPLTAIGFGWCWDMTDTGDQSELDTEYGVHWYGRSYYWNGSNTNSNYGAWGLDETDYTITGNPVSMKTYCLAVEEINVSSASTLCFFTTGPSDSSDEAGYQRWLKHEYIRDWVNERGGVLFDYADILNYNDAGELETTEWSGHEFPRMHVNNRTPQETGHITEDGAVRIAKAMWWMLARLAGWDGNP